MYKMRPDTCPEWYESHCKRLHVTRVILYEFSVTCVKQFKFHVTRSYCTKRIVTTFRLATCRTGNIVVKCVHFDTFGTLKDCFWHVSIVTRVNLYKISSETRPFWSGLPVYNISCHMWPWVHVAHRKTFIPIWAPIATFYSLQKRLWHVSNSSRISLHILLLRQVSILARV